MTNGPLNRKFKMGLVGGGQGSFIGKVHSIAACLDNRATVAAGAFSSNPDRSKASAPDYDVPPERAYASFQEMLTEESKKPKGERIDHMHFDVAKAALLAGFHVVCDKPMTFDLAQAEELAKIVDQNKAVFALTHNYTGYPLVRQAREMILSGELGEIQAVRSNYIQGWLRTRLESSDQKQAAWRTDPKTSGAAGCFGDIATHAYNLGRFMTGLLPAEISCHLKIFESGRKLDDYGTAIVKYQNGGLGTVTASQISHGRENDLSIEIDGTKGSLSWRQEEPNVLVVRQNGQPHKLYTRDPNAPFMNASGRAACRLPSGHPEAFFEAFANIYCATFDAMIEVESGKTIEKVNTVYPNVHDGVEGMYFIQQCVASSSQNGAWLPMNHPRCRK
jgi:predicted dehydrogenase